MQVYVIDDEEVLRDSLSWLLESRDVKCDSFASGEAFIAAFSSVGVVTPFSRLHELQLIKAISG